MGNPISVTHGTVADVMLTTPKTHGVEATVGEAQDAFADPHVHMLLLTLGGELRGTLLRGDLATHLDRRCAAIDFASLGGRTVGPDQHVDEAMELLTRGQTRRLAVIDDDRTLLGLLCLKRTLRGFCDASDVLARADGQP